MLGSVLTDQKKGKCLGVCQCERESKKGEGRNARCISTTSKSSGESKKGVDTIHRTVGRGSHWEGAKEKGEGKGKTGHWNSSRDNETGKGRYLKKKVQEQGRRQPQMRLKQTNWSGGGKLEKKKAPSISLTRQHQQELSKRVQPEIEK